MGLHEMATISLIAPDDEVVISGGGFDFRDIKLDVDPEGPFSDELTLKTIDTTGAAGGIAAGEDVPIRELTLPFNLYDTGGGIEATISRFRRLWRSGRTIQWQVETEYSGLRWLNVRRSAGIQFSQSRDWNLDGYAKATVKAVALQPNYESAPLEVTAVNPSSGSHTLWLPAWNPTDQDGWPEWALNPNGGTATFSFADFSFGNEQEIDPTLTPGAHADRMIITPAINVMWSVMSDPIMDTYVAANLSNANGQMGGVEPLYWMPAYTGTSDSPVLLPALIHGPAGAQVKLTMRRFWSAESGLE